MRKENAMIPQFFYVCLDNGLDLLLCEEAVIDSLVFICGIIFYFWKNRKG